MKIYSHLVDVMEQYGGSFARAIARAYRLADVHNAEKLEEAFAPLFNSYEKFLK